MFQSCHSASAHVFCFTLRRLRLETSLKHIRMGPIICKPKINFIYIFSAKNSLPSTETLPFQYLSGAAQWIICILCIILCHWPHEVYCIYVKKQWVNSVNCHACLPSSYIKSKARYKKLTDIDIIIGNKLFLLEKLDGRVEEKRRKGQQEIPLTSMRSDWA